MIVGFVTIYLLAGAAIFASAEGWPFFDSFYFAVVTVSVGKDSAQMSTPICALALFSMWCLHLCPFCN